MKKYLVSIPITGIATVEVEAESESEACEIAIGQECELQEWETHRKICRGNVFSGMMNEVNAEEI